MTLDLTAPGDAFLGRNVAWGIGGYVFRQLTDLDQDKKVDNADGSMAGDLYKNNLPGMIDASAKISGKSTMRRGKLGYILDQWTGRSAPLDFWHADEGLGFGNPIVGQRSSIKTNSTKSKLNGTVDFDLELGARAWMGLGTQLVSPGQLISGSSLTGQVDDNTSATSFGGVGQLHIVDITGGTTPGITVKIQHSGDSGSTWVDLITFAAATTIGSQWVKLPSVATVNGQVRASAAITGSPTSIQMMLGFFRGSDLS